MQPYSICSNIRSSEQNIQTIDSIQTKIHLNNEEATINLSLSISNQPVKFLIDSGSSISLINSKFIKDNINLNQNKKIEIIGATGHSALTLAVVHTEISIGNCTFKHDFHVYGNDISINSGGILGWDFLKKFKGNIDFENEKLILRVPQLVEKSTIQSKKMYGDNVIDGENTKSIQTESMSKENSSIHKINDRENDQNKTVNSDTIKRETKIIKNKINLNCSNNNSNDKISYNPYLKTSNKKHYKQFILPQKTFHTKIKVRNLYDNNKISNYIKNNVANHCNGIIIPERCEQIIEIATSLEKNNNLICKTKEILPKVYIKNAVLQNEKGKIRMIVQNFNNFPIKLTQTEFDSLDLIQTKHYNVFSFKNSKSIDPNDRLKIIYDKLNLTHCTKEELNIINHLCQQNTECFFIDGDPMNHTNLIEHSIELKPDSKPVFTKQYRLPESQRREIRKQLEKMEQEGIIEKTTNSEYNSPILLVEKHTNKGEEKKFRLVVDFRKINEITIPIRFPIPNIDSIIDTFSGAKFFSTMDLNGAFHQIKLRESDRKYTAFQSDLFRYQYTSMPQGLCTSPFTMQEAANLALQDLFSRGVRIYIDDIVIFTKTLEEHIELLKEVFARLKKFNLKLKAEKCFFFKKQIEFLGFVITEHGSLPNPNKTDCIKQYPQPKSVVEIQRFLGLCNYYRKFINNFAKIAKPMYNLCQKDVPFIWNRACETGFNDLKNALSTPPILIFPDFNETFVVHTDASSVAVGAVLSQFDKPIQYASKTLNAAQRNYSTIERELFAIIFALETFRHYLLGFEFILYSDHKPLIYLFNSKRHQSKLYRWRTCLSDYNFKILYKSGSQNIVADALSRIQFEQPKSLHEIVPNMETKFVQAITRSRAKQLTVSSETQIDNTSNKNSEIPYENILQSCIIQENNNVLVDTKDIDHIFYILPKRNCELRKKIERKLKMNIELPAETLGCVPYSIDKHRTIFILPYTFNHNENNMLTKLTLQNILKICTDFGYGEIAMNIDIKDAKTYFEFKFICTQIFHAKNIKIHFYLNRVIEISTIEDINSILKTYHDSSLAGHASFEKTKNSIRRYYSWPTMNDDIKRYVKNCQICKKTKITRHTRSPMQITSTANHPFQKLYIDHVIVHKESGTHKYPAILTCICELTKYAIAIKVKDLTALTTAKKLVSHVFLKHNIPTTLVSDQGSAFTSNLFSEITKLFKIRKITTTPYRPNANIVERFHRTLAQILSAMVHENPETWTEQLDSAVFAYNNMINSATGFSPHSLLYGFNIELPNKITNNDSPIYNYDNFHEQLRLNLSKNWRLAHEKINQEKIKNKIQRDKKQNPIEIEVGDNVFWYKPHKEHKYGTPYEGPYEVVQILSPVNVQIKKGNKITKVHKDHLILA